MDLLHSEHLTSILAGILVFIFTIIFVAKRYISFSLAAFFLILALIALVIIDQKKQQTHPTITPVSSLQADDTEDDFRKQMKEAIEDLKNEVTTERENLHNVISQMQQLFDSVETQKQKLQHFIEETKERFKGDEKNQEAYSL